MKKLAIVATISAAIIGLSACSSGDSEVVVEMDQGNITKEEFYEELKAISGETVLHSMVYASILEDKYEVDNDHVDDQVELMREQYGDAFEMVLQQSGFASEDDYRKMLKLHLLEQEAFTEDIEVSDEEIQLRYDRLLTEIEASHILVADEELANDLHGQLLDGADFSELAQEHSMDPGSAAEGGQLGFFSAGDMVAEFENAAYELDVDEISEPVQSTHGWHIIKVTATRDSEREVDSFDDMKARLRTEIALPQVEETVATAKMRELLEGSNIKVNIDEFKDLFTFEDLPEVDDLDLE
ncbi:peptidylprolyl isomerase [Amphibacillus indicireducens]|uniref:Foldase protein PrsA n=1 Tax=Amphibacillus indicireducens TaxID=1076330 RepID=A0ABP7V4X1_9BACI